jgi:hypothetical protein
VTCTDKCILSNDTSLPYQDFNVLNPISVNGLRINIDTYYGTGGGLGSVEIFRSGIHNLVNNISISIYTN